MQILKDVTLELNEDRMELTILKERGSWRSGSRDVQIVKLSDETTTDDIAKAMSFMGAEK